MNRFADWNRDNVVWSFRQPIATVTLPGTRTITRTPAYGYDTLDLRTADDLVGIVYSYRTGEPVTVTLKDDGVWYSEDERVARILNEYFGPRSGYRLRLGHAPIGPLASMALDVAWYLGGNAQLHVKPQPTEPGVEY